MKASVTALCDRTGHTGCQGVGYRIRPRQGCGVGYGIRPRLRRSDPYMLDRVATRREEATEVRRRDDEGGSVDVGVKRQARRGLEVAVDDDADGVLAVVDEAEGRDGTRRKPRGRHHPF